jgi:hypothetical protein
MENYNEKEVKMIEYSVVICLILFVIFGGLYLKNNEKEKAQATQAQATQTVVDEEHWEKMVYKSAEERKLPAAWTVNAYREAKSFYEKCKHEGISREELKRHLMNEFYTEEVANFVTFYVREADFKEQALTLAKWAQSKEPDRYSEQNPEGESNLRLLLTLAYFTDEEIDYAVTKFYNK